MSELYEVQAARFELYARAAPSPTSVAYVRRHGIDTTLVSGFCGCLVVLPIIAHANAVFDFADEGGLYAVIVEAFERDGETVSDLVAWPLDSPTDVRTMFGRASLLGLWEAMNPMSYTFDRPLALYRTPLEWLQAGCTGAAVVVPNLAARMLLDLPGRIAARDRRHAADIEELMLSLFNRQRVLVHKRSAA